MIIDGHAHSSGDFYRSDSLINDLDKLGVDKVVLCPGLINGPRRHIQPQLSDKIKKKELMFSVNKLIRLIAYFYNPERDLDAGNKYVYLMKQKYPERVYQFYWTNPEADNALEELEEKFESYRFSGIKLHQCSDSFSCDSENMYLLSELAADMDIPVFIHLFSRQEVRRFLTLARNNPCTDYIVGHLIGAEFFEENAKDMTNLYFDISPQPLISDYRIYKTIDTFGADRIIFGSDTPYGRDNLLNNLKRVKQMNINDEQKEMILGGNMKRLLRI